MLDRKLELNKTIKAFLPTIKKVFIEYYGEKYAAIIEKRLDNATYVGYAFPEEIKRVLDRIYDKKKFDLIKESLPEFDFALADNNYPYPILDYLFSYVKTEQHTPLDDIRFLNCLKMISGNKQLKKDSTEYDEIKEKIERLSSTYESILESDEFIAFKKQYKPYADYLSSCEALKKKIFDSPLSGTIEIDTDLDEDEMEIVNDLFSKDDEELASLIEAFSSESEEQLNSSEVSDFIKNSIINDRIRYFQKIGFDLGNDYQNYIRDPKCIAQTPSTSVADIVKQVNSFIYQQKLQDYIEATTIYKEQLEEINSLYLFTESSYNFRYLSSNGICVQPNMRKKDDAYEIYSLLFFPLNQTDDYFDVSLIHECNHLIDLSTFERKENAFEIFCGFDHIKISQDTIEHKEENQREYEAFNEAINELIAQEVTTLMHSHSIYIFDDKKTAKIKNGNDYEPVKLLIEDFFQIYKEEIIESRLTGNLDVLFSKVGRDNFNEFNKLISDCHERTTNKRHELFDNLSNGRDTDDVLYYKKCIIEKDKILGKMADYAKKASNGVAK